MTTVPDGEDIGSCASRPCSLRVLDRARDGAPSASATEARDRAPRSRAARLLPARRFPPYAYLPGRCPHPVRDPRGHSHDPHAASGAVPAQDPDAMSWGMDLFNHGYYWEAHEAWEPLWRGAPRATPERDVLQALILLAAAGIKLREHKPAAARRHGLRAAGLIRKVAAGGREDARLGLPAEALAAAAERAVLSSASRAAEAIVFDIALGAPPATEPGLRWSDPDG